MKTWIAILLLRTCYLLLSSELSKKSKEKFKTWYFLRFNLRFFQFEAIAENELSIKSSNQIFFRLQTNKIPAVDIFSGSTRDFLRFNLRFFQFEAIAENELSIKSPNQCFFRLQNDKITVINLRNTWKNLRLKTDKKTSCFQTWKNHRF